MHLWCIKCIWRNTRMEKYKNAVIFFTVESCFDIVELLYKWNCKEHLSVRYSSSCSFKTYIYEDGVNKASVHLWQMLDSVFKRRDQKSEKRMFSMKYLNFSCTSLSFEGFVNCCSNLLGIKGNKWTGPSFARQRNKCFKIFRLLQQ